MARKPYLPQSPKAPGPEHDEPKHDNVETIHETQHGDVVVQRDKQGQWAPGVSGNMQGRPKFNPEVKRLLWEGVPKAITFCMKVLDDDSADIKDRMTASRMILEWGLSKPSSELPTEQVNVLGALATILAKAKGPAQGVAPTMRAIRASVDGGEA